MRKFVLGAVLWMAFGLPVYGVELPSGAMPTSVKHPAKHPAKRLACDWVTADRTLRLLRYSAVPVVKASRAVTRAEPVRLERQRSQQISLTVGVAY
jgi:hypothetical protein